MKYSAKQIFKRPMESGPNIVSEAADAAHAALPITYDIFFLLLILLYIDRIINYN